jgi:hypothetical protein
MLGREYQYDSAGLQEHPGLGATSGSEQHRLYYIAVGFQQHGWLGAILSSKQQQRLVILDQGSGPFASSGNTRLLIRFTN